MELTINGTTVDTDRPDTWTPEVRAILGAAVKADNTYQKGKVIVKHLGGAWSKGFKKGARRDKFELRVPSAMAMGITRNSLPLLIDAIESGEVLEALKEALATYPDGFTDPTWEALKGEQGESKD